MASWATRRPGTDPTVLALDTAPEAMAWATSGASNGSLTGESDVASGATASTVPGDRGCPRSCIPGADETVQAAVLSQLQAASHTAWTVVCNVAKRRTAASSDASSSRSSWPGNAVVVAVRSSSSVNSTE